MEDFILLVDTSEIANCLKRRKTQKRKSQIMTDLLDPVFSHREEDPVTGRNYQVFKLGNIEKLGISYKVVQLQFGDYHFPSINDEGKRVIQVWERKTMADLISSFAGSVKVGSGKKSKIRLTDQLKDDWKLGEEYYGDIEVNLLIEDFYQCNFDYDKNNWGVWIPVWTNYKTDKSDREGRSYYKSVGYSRRAMHPNAILGKIESLETKGIEVKAGEWKPINVIKCDGAQHAYDTLVENVLPSKKARTRGVRPTRRKPKNMSITDNQRFLLEGLPGFGGGMAKKALELHPVPIDFLNDLVGARDAGDLGIPRFGKTQFEPSKAVLTSNYLELLEKEGNEGNDEDG